MAIVDVAMDWRDIKWFHEVVVHGSFSAAARAADTTQATISRRIKALEEELGIDLFRRGHAGSVLTEAGQRLAESARSMNQSFTEFLRQHRGIKRERRTIVITCGGLLGLHLSKHLGQLQDGVDDVDIDMKTTSDFLDIDKGEADIALRNKRPTKGMLTAKMIRSDGRWSVFGSREHYEGRRFADIEALKAEPWAGYPSGVEVPSARWQREHIGEDKLKFRLNNSPLLLEVISQNRALAVLPDFVGDATDGLVSVFGPVDVGLSRLFVVRRESDTDERLLAVVGNIAQLF